MEKPFKVLGITAGDKFCYRPKVEFRPVFKTSLPNLRNQCGQNLPKGFKPANKQTLASVKFQRSILLNFWKKNKKLSLKLASILQKCSTERSFWDF